MSEPQKIWILLGRRSDTEPCKHVQSYKSQKEAERAKKELSEKFPEHQYIIKPPQPTKGGF